MRRNAALALLTAWSAIVPALPAASQDVPGIEICTRETRLDRRTGCLQSNVEFLQQLVARNAFDAREKLGAASRDISMLKDELATARRETAALKETLAAIELRIEQLAKSAPAPPAVSASPAKPQGK